MVNSFKKILPILGTFIPITNSFCIENMNHPICQNCKFYRPSFMGEKYGKCEKFGKKDVISGEVTNSYVDIARNFNHMCGLQGKEFIQEKNMVLRNIKLKIMHNTPFYIAIGSILLYVLTLSYLIKNKVS